jgi:hypothetical protein
MPQFVKVVTATGIASSNDENTVDEVVQTFTPPAGKIWWFKSLHHTVNMWAGLGSNWGTTEMLVRQGGWSAFDPDNPNQTLYAWSKQGSSAALVVESEIITTRLAFTNSKPLVVRARAWKADVRWFFAFVGVEADL